MRVLRRAPTGLRIAVKRSRSAEAWLALPDTRRAGGFAEPDRRGCPERDARDRTVEFKFHNGVGAVALRGG